MSDLRFLVVGAGTMGARYSALLSSGLVPGVALAGVVDLVPERAAAAAGNAPWFGDIEEALAQLRPDAAYVATPDALHRAPTEALARAGVALLVEKPLATTVSDAEAMVQAARNAGIHAEVNFSNRWNPPFVAARSEVDAGNTGEVISFNVRLNNPSASPRERLSWSGQTTPAWFLMSHCLDLAGWLSGKHAESVYATGRRGLLAAGGGPDTYDFIHAIVRWREGGDGVFESCWVLPESWPGAIEFNFRLLGTKAAIDVDTTRQAISVYGDRHRFPGTMSWAPARLADFARAVRGDPRTTVPLEDGLHNTRILVAIHRSLESGQVETV